MSQSWPEPSTLLAKQVSRQVEMQNFMPPTEVCVYLDVWNYFEDCKFGIEAVPHAEVLLFNLDLQLTIAEGAPLLLQVTFAHLEELHLPKTHKANHSWTAR